MNLRPVLPTLLALYFAVELVLLRVVRHALEKNTPWTEGAASFALQWVGVLALATSALATVGLVTDTRVFGRTARLGFAVLGAMFLPLALLAHFVGIPSSLDANLRISFALTLLGLGLGLSVRRVDPREKVAILLLMLAPTLSVIASLWARAPMFDYRVSEGSFRLGRILSVGGLPLAAILYARAPLRELFRGWALWFGVGTAAASLALLRSPDLCDRLLGAALGLPLPGSASLRILLVGGGAVFVTVCASMWRRSLRERTTAVALMLIAMAGYLFDPHHMVIVQVAFVLLARVSTWPLSEIAFVSPERWAIYVNAVARALGAASPVVIEDGPSTITRIRRSQPATDLRIVRCGGEVQEIGVTVGVAPPAPPAYTSGGRVHPPGVTLPRGLEALGTIVPGDARDWPQEFVDGWLGIWPGEAVQVRLFPVAASSPGPIPMTAIAAGLAGDPPTESLLHLVQSVEQFAKHADVGPRAGSARY